MRNDTDRMGHRRSRTARRVLTLTLVGIPLAGLCVWSAVTFAAADSSSVAGDTGNGCDPSGPYAYIDLAACPLSGPALTNHSPCSAYNTDNSRTPSANATNPDVYYLNLHEVADVLAFDRKCAASPDDTLATTLAAEGIQVPPTDDDNADPVSP